MQEPQPSRATGTLLSSILFQVLKDLFDMYPETMLAKSIAEHRRDPDSQKEIFLDR